MWWELVHADAEAEETADQGASEAGGICGPGVRWGHTCNAVRGGRYLYVFGGYGRDNCQTNDVHVFDTGGWWLLAGSLLSRFVLYCAVSFASF